MKMFKPCWHWNIPGLPFEAVPSKRKYEWASRNQVGNGTDGRQARQWARGDYVLPADGGSGGGPRATQCPTYPAHVHVYPALRGAAELAVHPDLCARSAVARAGVDDRPDHQWADRPPFGATPMPTSMPSSILAHRHPPCLKPAAAWLRPILTRLFGSRSFTILRRSARSWVRERISFLPSPSPANRRKKLCAPPWRC